MTRNGVLLVAIVIAAALGLTTCSDGSDEGIDAGSTRNVGGGRGHDDDRARPCRDQHDHDGHHRTTATTVRDDRASRG